MNRDGEVVMATPQLQQWSQNVPQLVSVVQLHELLQTQRLAEMFATDISSRRCNSTTSKSSMFRLTTS